MKEIDEANKTWEQREGYSKKVLYPAKELPGKTNQLQRMQIKKGQKVKEHYHKNTSELFYCMSGKAIFKINGKTIEMKKGKAVLCEAGEKHEVLEVKEDLEFLTFKINQKENDTVWL